MMNSDHPESPDLSLGSGVLARSRLTLEREMKLIIRDVNKTTCCDTTPTRKKNEWHRISFSFLKDKPAATPQEPQKWLFQLPWPASSFDGGTPLVGNLVQRKANTCMHQAVQACGSQAHGLGGSQAFMTPPVLSVQSTSPQPSKH